METYEVGEIAIYVRPESPYHLSEITITGDLNYCSHISNRRDKEITKGYVYDIFLDGFGDGVCRPKYLRKKKKKKEKTTTWSEIERLTGWQPKEIA